MDYIQSFTNRTHLYLEAINKYKNVLDEEMKTAIEMLYLQPNDVVFNAFSGGIPLDKYINKDLNIKYLEYDIHKDFTTNSYKLDKIPIESNSVNKIICLATLHHLNITEREIIYKEFYRILLPGGSLVIGDVIDKSSQSKWLNIFVDKYNSNGHKGLFFSHNDSILMNKSGFKHIDISINNYNWNFKNDSDLINFFKLLFGLNLCNDDDLLLDNIKYYLNYNNFKIPWQLIYFNCKK